MYECNMCMRVCRSHCRRCSWRCSRGSCNSRPNHCCMLHLSTKSSQVSMLFTQSCQSFYFFILGYFNSIFNQSSSCYRNVTVVYCFIFSKIVAKLLSCSLARSACLPSGLYVSVLLTSFFLINCPLGKLADRAIYFACINFFPFLTIAQRTIISGSPGAIFAIFSPNESVLGCDLDLFQISQGTFPWQTNNAVRK